MLDRITRLQWPTCLLARVTYQPRFFMYLFCTYFSKGQCQRSPAFWINVLSIAFRSDKKAVISSRFSTECQDLFWIFGFDFVFAELRDWSTNEQQNKNHS